MQLSMFKILFEDTFWKQDTAHLYICALLLLLSNHCKVIVHDGSRIIDITLV